MYEAKNFVRGVKKSHSLSNLRDWTWWHLYTYASTLWRPPSIRLCLNSKRLREACTGSPVKRLRFYSGAAILWRFYPRPRRASSFNCITWSETWCNPIFSCQLKINLRIAPDWSTMSGSSNRDWYSIGDTSRYHRYLYIPAFIISLRWTNRRFNCCLPFKSMVLNTQ